MNKYIPLFVLALLGAVFAFTVTPTSVTVNSGDTSRHQISVANPDNSSVTYSLSTNCGSYIVLSTSSLTVPANSSDQFYFVVSPFPTENKTCNILVNSSTSKQVTVNLVAKTSPTYKYNKTKWVLPNEEVSITVEGQRYDMLINDVSDTIDFDIYMGNTKIDTESLGEGDTTDSIDEVNLKVLKLYPTTHRAKFQIYSTQTSDIQVTMSSLGELATIPKSQSFLLASLDKRQFTIKFKNKFDTPLEIDAIRLDQVTEGFRLDYTSQDSLDPGEELPVVLTIDPALLSIGQHIIHVCMDATYRDRSISSCSEIDVTIPNSAVVEYATMNIQINMPSDVLVGTEIPVNISGVNRPNDITISSDKNDLIINTKTLTAGHGMWTAKVTFAKPGVHTLTFLFKGNQFATRTVNVINTSAVSIKFSPKTAGPGDTVNVTAYLNNKKLSLPITVNGNKTSSFKVAPGVNYTVCVTTQFDKKCITKLFQKPDLLVNFPKLDTSGVLNPSAIRVSDQSGNKITGYTILVDGSQVQGKIKLEAGSHEVTVKAPGYNAYSSILTVPKPPSLLEKLGLSGNTGQIIIAVIIVAIFAVLLYIMKNKRRIRGSIASSESLDMGFAPAPPAPPQSSGSEEQ